MSTTPADVKFAHVLLALSRGLADKSLKWAAMLLAGGVTVGAMVHPDPVRAAVAVLLVALLSPLWLRREKADG